MTKISLPNTRYGLDFMRFYLVERSLFQTPILKSRQHDEYLD